MGPNGTKVALSDSYSYLPKLRKYRFSRSIHTKTFDAGLKIVRPFPAVFTHCGTYKINDMNQKRLRNTAVAASVWWPQWLLHQVQITWTTFVINYFDESLSLDSSKVGHQWCHRTYNHKLESSIERGDYGLVNHAAVRHKMTGLRHETELHDDKFSLQVYVLLARCTLCTG